MEKMHTSSKGARPGGRKNVRSVHESGKHAHFGQTDRQGGMDLRPPGRLRQSLFGHKMKNAA